MAKRTQQRKSPSRERYERRHPVKSFRISEELDRELEEARKARGLSITDVLKAGLGRVAVNTKTEKEIRDQALEEGRQIGFRQAMALYQVRYLCSNCGREMVVTSDEEKKAIRMYMREHGWCHGHCPMRTEEGKIRGSDDEQRVS